MCAIVDANAAHEVFPESPVQGSPVRPPAGRGFFDWICKGDGRLVVGGKLREELDKTGLKNWMRTARQAGHIRLVDDESVDRRAGELDDEGACQSNDSHVVALAEISGARLLYTNDGKLQEDFKKLVQKGRVYSTNTDVTPRNRHFTRAKQDLLVKHKSCPP